MAILPKIRPSRIATTLSMNIGFRRSSGVEKRNKPMAIGTRRVGKTVSTTRRLTFAESSAWIAGGIGGRDASDSAGFAPEDMVNGRW